MLMDWPTCRPPAERWRTKTMTPSRVGFQKNAAAVSAVVAVAMPTICQKKRNIQIKDKRKQRNVMKIVGRILARNLCGIPEELGLTPPEGCSVAARQTNQIENAQRFKKMKQSLLTILKESLRI